MAGKNKRKLEDLSVDEFMLSGFDSEDEDDQIEEDLSQQNGKRKKLENTQKKSIEKKGKASEHKDQLSALKSSDPEFYQFLEKNDHQLLNFDDSDSSDEGSDDEGDDMYHKLPSQLEEDHSEDEGAEDAEESKKKDKKSKYTKITKNMIENWRNGLRKEPKPSLIREITQAFKAAVATTTGSEDLDEPTKYTITDSAVFNSLILLCIREMPAALQKMLNLKAQENSQKKLVLPSSSTRWQKNQNYVKMYITGVLKLLTSLSQVTVTAAVVRHCNMMVPYFLCLPKLCRPLLKNLILLWSTGEETVRVLAFLVINKICRHKQEAYLKDVLKKMYIAYVKNCKFTSPNSLPLISFMQRTLTEMYSMDTHLSYQYGFIYIRQLAIHLRNAISLKKKDSYQSVYNWQFVHCLFLWSRVLSTIYPSEVLEPLIYPLCQVIIGCIKLVPVARYYPLRFHCVRAIMLLSANTKTFVPTLPFLLEILQEENFNKKPGRMSVKPINFAVILKLSKTGLEEKAYKDGLIEQLYDLILEYLNTQACSIGFPELALPTIIQLKAFLKECKVSNYCKQMRQLLEKIQENCNYITGRRQKADFGVADSSAVASWEKQVAEEGTPLTTYYNQWRKLRDKEIQLEISGKERMEDLKLPEIKRKNTSEKKPEEPEFKGLFESGSEDDDDDLFRSKGENDDSEDDDASMDLSNGGEEDLGSSGDDSEGEQSSSSLKSKEPKKILSQELKHVAEGDEDVVQDLDLSDQD